jgi:polar amino acid transport system ATP-binding protein
MVAPPAEAESVTWDPELVGEVLGLVRDLKGEGMMMIVATHEMSFAREVADEVCFPHDGAIVEARLRRAHVHRARASRDAALPAPPSGRPPDLSRRPRGILVGPAVVDARQTRSVSRGRP